MAATIDNGADGRGMAVGLSDVLTSTNQPECWLLQDEHVSLNAKLCRGGVLYVWHEADLLGLAEWRVPAFPRWRPAALAASSSWHHGACFRRGHLAPFPTVFGGRRLGAVAYGYLVSYMRTISKPMLAWEF